MAQTAVKEIICDVCGAEVRDASLFCYNCGSSVTDQAVPNEIEAQAAEMQSPEPQSNGNLIGKDSENESVKPTELGRVRPRKRPIQNRDVIWAERDGMSVGFVATTLILVVLSAAILIAGFYYR